jgi:hypothetical protein
VFDWQLALIMVKIGFPRRRNRNLLNNARAMPLRLRCNLFIPMALG